VLFLPVLFTLLKDLLTDHASILILYLAFMLFCSHSLLASTQLVDMWFMSGAKQRQAVAREYALERRRMWSGLDKLTSAQRLKSVDEMGLAPSVKAAAVKGASGGLPSSSAFSAAASAVLDFQATAHSPKRNSNSRNFDSGPNFRSINPLSTTREGGSDFFDGNTTAGSALWASDGAILAVPDYNDDNNDNNGGESAEIQTSRALSGVEDAPRGTAAADIDGVAGSVSTPAAVDVPQPLPLATRLSLATARARTAGLRNNTSRGDNPLGPSLLAFAQAAMQREEQRQQSHTPNQMSTSDFHNTNNTTTHNPTSGDGGGDCGAGSGNDWPLQPSRVGTAATTSSRASVTRGARGRLVAAQSIRSVARPLELERAKPRPATHQLMVATYANGRSQGPRSATPAQARSLTVGGGKSFVAPPLPPRRADARSSPSEWVAALAASGLGAAKATQIATLVHEEEKAEANRAAVFEDALQRHARALQDLRAKHAKAAAAAQSEIQSCQDAANELYSRQSRRVKNEPPPLSLLVNPTGRKVKTKAKAKKTSTAIVAAVDSDAEHEGQDSLKPSSDAPVVVAAAEPSFLATEAKLQADADARAAAVFKQAATLVKQASKSEQDASRSRAAEAAALEASGAHEQAALLAMFRKQRDAFVARLAAFAENYNPAPALLPPASRLAFESRSSSNALTLRPGMDDMGLVSNQNSIGKVLEGGAVDTSIWAEGSDAWVDFGNAGALQGDDKITSLPTRGPDLLPLLGAAEAEAEGSSGEKGKAIACAASPLSHSGNLRAGTTADVALEEVESRGLTSTIAGDTRGNAARSVTHRRFGGPIPAATDAKAASPSPLFEGRRALASRGSSVVSLPIAHTSSSGRITSGVGHRSGTERSSGTEAVPALAAGGPKPQLPLDASPSQKANDGSLGAIVDASSLQGAQDSKVSPSSKKRKKKKQVEDTQQWFQRSAAGGHGFEQAPPEYQPKDFLNVNSSRAEPWLPAQSLSAEERHQAYHFGVPLSLELPDLPPSSDERSGQLHTDSTGAATTSTASVSVGEGAKSSCKGGEATGTPTDGKENGDDGLVESKSVDTLVDASGSEAGVASEVTAAFVAGGCRGSNATLPVPSQLLVALTTLRGRRPAENNLLSQLRSFRAKTAHVSAVDTMNKEILRAALVARGESNEALKDCEEFELKARFKAIIENEHLDGKSAAKINETAAGTEENASLDSSALSPGAAAAHGLLAEASASVDEYQPVLLLEFSQLASFLDNVWGHSPEPSNEGNYNDGGGTVYDCIFSTVNLGLRFRFVAELGIIEVAADSTESQASDLQEQQFTSTTEGAPLQQQEQDVDSTLPQAGDLLLACNGNSLGWVSAPGTFQDSLMAALRPLRLTLQRPLGHNISSAAVISPMAATPSTNKVMFEWNTEIAPEEVELALAVSSKVSRIARYTHERIFDQVNLGFTMKFVAANGGSLVVAAVLKPQVTGPLLRAGDILVACNNQDIGPISDPMKWRDRLARSRPILLKFMRNAPIRDDHVSSSGPQAQQRTGSTLKALRSASDGHDSNVGDIDDDFAPPRYPHGHVELGPGMGAAVGLDLR